MDQYRVIEMLYRWLGENRRSDAIRVKCDHVTEAKETLGLYIGPKLPGQGRRAQIAQVDLLVCNDDTRTVELIVEVDKDPNPKKALGDILSVLIADNYTPSNSYTPYRIDGTLVIYVTAFSGRAGSQKAAQYERIEQAVHSKLDLERLGVKSVRLCYGRTEEEAVRNCQEIIVSELFHAGDGKPVLETRAPEASGSTAKEYQTNQPVVASQKGRTMNSKRETVWYFWKDQNGKKRFLAFVNAKGSCSIRAFDAESGDADRKRPNQPGDFREVFRDYLRSCISLPASPEVNLEEKCKVRLPSPILAELRRQIPRSAR